MPKNRIIRGSSGVKLTALYLAALVLLYIGERLVFDSTTTRIALAVIAFLAIDIAQMMPLVDFKARMDGLIREIRSAPKTSDAERIYLPGEMEWERHDAAVTEDILLPSDVVANLRGLAEDVGMDASSLFPAEG